jgi:hypothetical protein
MIATRLAEKERANVKEAGVSRQSRQAQDRRTTQDRVLSEDDRLEVFRMQLFNDALPDIPDIPGVSCVLAHDDEPA